MRPLPPCPVFAVADLLVLGWTPSAVRNAVRTGRLTRIRHGVYCAGLPTPLTTALAAAVAYPGASLSHRSALLQHALPLLGGPADEPEMTVPPRASVTMPGVHVYRATLRPPDRIVIDGGTVTTVARTLVDVARHSGLDGAVVAMDAALHRDPLLAGGIERVLRDQRGWPGARKAMQAFELADASAESPLESVSRLAFPRVGLPAPRTQLDVLDLNGNFLGRCDFVWDDLGVIGEADGLSKYRDPDDDDVLVREKLRQDALERTGLAVARWGWAEAWRNPDELRARVLSAFDRARARDRAGLPRRWHCRTPAERHHRPAAFAP